MQRRPERRTTKNLTNLLNLGKLLVDLLRLVVLVVVEVVEVGVQQLRPVGDGGHEALVGLAIFRFDLKKREVMTS